MFEFVKKNASADPRALLLALHGKETGFPAALAVTQIECRRKCSRKLAAFTAHERFLFPTAQAAEQATHQCVASYHAGLVGTGRRVADITAGLGIDAFTVAEAGNEVRAFELAPERASALRHNAEVLGAANVSVTEGDSLAALRDDATRYDVIFVDPARRDAADRRTFLFRDCLPDIVSNLALLRSRADRIMVKASPILDTERMVAELPGISEIHLVCVKGECKEVLGIIGGGGGSDKIAVTVVDLRDNADATAEPVSVWRTTLGETGNAGAPVASESDIRPGAYIYDPNAGIHKLGCGRELCSRFDGLRRISSNTDLYVSDSLIEDFPGRAFRITGVIGSKESRRLKGERREVMARNYVMSADSLRQRLKVVSGGDKTIIGCRAGTLATPLLLECEKPGIGGVPRT